MRGSKWSTVARSAESRRTSSRTENRVHAFSGPRTGFPVSRASDGLDKRENGIDYLQVYEADDSRRVSCIDQLRQSLTESGEFTKEQLAEYDHWTMLLPEEY